MLLLCQSQWNYDIINITKAIINHSPISSAWFNKLIINLFLGVVNIVASNLIEFWNRLWVLFSSRSSNSHVPRTWNTRICISTHILYWSHLNISCSHRLLGNQFQINLLIDPYAWKHLTPLLSLYIPNLIVFILFQLT